MSSLDFLAAVLPPPGHGYYCVAELSSSKKEHVYVEQLDEASGTTGRWMERRRDIYFGLATYAERGSRKADNARYLNALFIDMDGYETKRAAGEALSAFLQRTGLQECGSPWIVSSGGGLHCYWAFTEPVSVATWKPVAENLKRLCKQEGLVIDMTVTADPARVLRIPGTYNFKKKYDTPRLVKVLAQGDTFIFDQLDEIIRSKLVALPHAAAHVEGIAGVKPTAAPASEMKLFENSAVKFKPIWLATQQGSGCGQLAHYAEHAAEDGMEPLWRGLLSIAKVCTDGTKAATWLSNMHPYDTERMQNKLRDIQGPYPCTKFDTENPGVCTKCRHWGKITNPLALGRFTPTENTERTYEFKQAAESTVVEEDAVVLVRPKPPRGFGYGVSGGVFMERELEDGDGIKTKKQIMLLPYDLFVVDILHSNAEHIVHMAAIRPDGVVDITMPMKAVVSKDETAKALAQQNIVASFGTGNDKNLAEYVRACVEQSSVSRSSVKVPSSYGWQPDDSYVFAGRIFSKTAEPTRVPMPGLENLTVNTEPKGTLDGWRKFVKMLVARKMYSHLAIMLAGASAPFMRFTGIYGLTYHCASTDSGTGKSLALEAAASIWGHPTHYRTGKGTSAVAMQQRLGLLNSHPLITDEITAKNREDFEWFPAFLLDMTEGRGKERMESGSNKERLNLSTWMTVCLMSSNTNAVDYLTGGRKHASEGELRRLLEFVQNERLSWEAHEVETIKSLQHNYGVAGYVLAEYMAKHVDEFPAMVSEVVSRMYVEFGATNDERFWMAGIGAAVAAGIVMSGKHADIVDLPMRGIIEHYRKVVDYMRNNMKHSAKSAEDVLNAYTRDSYGNFVVVKAGGGSFIAELGTGEVIDQTITRTKVSGRVEHGLTPGYIDYFIEEQLLRAYCSSMSFGYSDFKRQISLLYKVEYIKKDMMSKTRGPQMRVNVMKISRRITDSDEALTDLLPVG
jgi:hypothetical protein